MFSIVKSFYQSKTIGKIVVIFVSIAPYPAGSPKDSDSDIVESPKWVYAGKVENAGKKMTKDGIPYQEFMSADSTIVQGLETVALHSTHLFVDPNGNSREIYLAVATNDSQSGYFLNYVAHANMLQACDKEIPENVVSSCGGFINTDTTSSIPLYINWATTTLQNCGVMVGLSETEQFNESKFFIYLNPSASGFHLSSTTALTDIETYDTCGQKVLGHREISENQTLYINLIEQPGVYIFRAMDGDTPIIKKLVKQ